MVDRSERNLIGTPSGYLERVDRISAFTLGSGVGVNVGVYDGVGVKVFVGVLVAVPVAVSVAVGVLVFVKVGGSTFTVVGRSVFVAVIVTVAVGLADGTRERSLGPSHEPRQNKLMNKPMMPTLPKTGALKKADRKAISLRTSQFCSGGSGFVPPLFLGVTFSSLL